MFDSKIEAILHKKIPPPIIVGTKEKINRREYVFLVFITDIMSNGKKKNMLQKTKRERKRRGMAYTLKRRRMLLLM